MGITAATLRQRRQLPYLIFLRLSVKISRTGVFFIDLVTSLSLFQMLVTAMIEHIKDIRVNTGVPLGARHEEKRSIRVNV